MKNQIERRGASEAVTKLRAARTAWHEKNGVPISQEYANFLTAIGDLAAGHVVLLEALKAIANVCTQIIDGVGTNNLAVIAGFRTRAEAAIEQAERT